MRIKQTQPDIAVSEDSYFISLSDLMVGLLFIFIIILMAFAIAYRSAEHQLTNTDDLKKQLLIDIEKALKARGVEVSVDLQNGVLHLPESILFKSGSATLNDEGERNISILSETLYQLLPCYSEYVPKSDAYSCSANIKQGKGRLNTVFIEGHTDKRPMGVHGKYLDNWELSMARAIYTYKTLTKFQPNFDGLKNRNKQPILSVSAYADRRPVPEESSLTYDEQLAKNRRIDLRFLMVAPEAREAKKMSQVPVESEKLLNGNSR